MDSLKEVTATVYPNTSTWSIKITILGSLAKADSPGLVVLKSSLSSLNSPSNKIKCNTLNKTIPSNT